MATARTPKEPVTPKDEPVSTDTEVSTSAPSKPLFGTSDPTPEPEPANPETEEAEETPEAEREEENSGVAQFVDHPPGDNIDPAVYGTGTE